MREFDTPEAFKALASRLAAFISPVDFIALYGDLGAGKTAFAQGLLPALGVEETVTSPTYQLVHRYAGARHTIYHCDFYRIGPGEEDEIGFREMCEEGVVLAEWPDAIQRSLPADRLEVRIAGEGSTRTAVACGFWRVGSRSSRAFTRRRPFSKRMGGAMRPASPSGETHPRAASRGSGAARRR